MRPRGVAAAEGLPMAPVTETPTLCGTIVAYGVWTPVRGKTPHIVASGVPYGEDGTSGTRKRDGAQEL